MIKPVWAVFAIVAIAAMMGASTVAPAFAEHFPATGPGKLIDNINETTVSEPSKWFQSVCTIETVFVTFTITKTMKTWDNDKISFNQVTKIVFTDAKEGGKLVGSGVSTQTQVEENDTNPIKVIKQDNSQFSCKNGFSDSFLEHNTHEGSTTFFYADSTTIIHKSCHGPDVPPDCE